MEFANYRVEHWVLLDNLKNEVIKKTLGYMIDFKEHDNLVVIPKPHSIEISNNDLYIAVILFSGFQNEEYETLKGKNNHQENKSQKCVRLLTGVWRSRLHIHVSVQRSKPYSGEYDRGRDGLGRYPVHALCYSVECHSG